MLTPSKSRTVRRFKKYRRVTQRLPPGTILPLPTDPQVRVLAEELLHLPENVDPVSWLGMQRRDAVVTLALQIGAVALDQYLVGVQRLKDAGGALPPHAEAWLSAEEQVRILISMLNADNAGSRLQHPLSALRAIRFNVPLPRELFVGASALAFLDQLLSLPADANLGAWLERNAADIAAVVVVEHILSACAPPDQGEIGPRRYRLAPQERITLPDRMEITIDYVDVGERGLLVTCSLRMFVADLLRPAGIWKLVPTWAGFEQLDDDLGYAYFLQVMRAGESFTVMWGYPAPAACASKLTFASIKTTWHLLGIQMDRSAVILPDLELGGLLWQVDLPRP